jgi:hypothetical protein
MQHDSIDHDQQAVAASFEAHTSSSEQAREAELHKVIAELEVEMRRLVDILQDQAKH